MVAQATENTSIAEDIADAMVMPSPVLQINPQDRVCVFIDALNLMGMLRGVNKKIDYKKLLKFFEQEVRLIRANYFVVVRDDLDEVSEKKSRGVIDMIDYAGYEVHRKIGKETEHQNGHLQFRGTIVPEMSIAMIEAVENGADHIVAITGDGEFYAGFKSAKARGARITIIGDKNSTSDNIRRVCDSFINLSSLPDDLFL